ncbi:MAG: metallophosphoesterase family protein [Archaeoglobaceae archaeon]|nr:metallophosphoesterase family protein [Archaeoglobaceae archaeon]
MRLLTDAIAIGKKAVIADLHFGLVPFYDRKLVERVLKLAERFQTIIIAGDVKHLGKKSPVKDFLTMISGITELIIIRGNHDVGLVGCKSIKIGKYTIFHGHSIPEESVLDSEVLIFAHAHPSIFISAGAGGYKERAFLLGEIEWQGLKKVVVLPAFNELCSSTAVNLERPAGFMFRKFNYAEWNAILVDGTVLSLKSISKV